jgi:uncharacterized protein (DUF983 family)
MQPPLTEAEGLSWPGLGTFARMVARGLILRCPNCGGGPVTRGWFHLRERCPTCGILLERGEEDYFAGGMLLNIVICFIIFGVGFWAIVIATYPDVPWDLLEYGLVAAMILLPLLLYPISRVVWLGADLALRPRSEKDLDQTGR